MNFIQVILSKHFHKKNPTNPCEILENHLSSSIIVTSWQVSSNRKFACYTRMLMAIFQFDELKRLIPNIGRVCVHECRQNAIISHSVDRRN